MGVNHADKESGTDSKTGREPEEIAKVTVDTFSLKRRCATDLDLFAALLLPGVATVAYPPYYHMLWQLFTTLEMDHSKVFRFALGLPRGHAKTTFIKLLICWLVLYGRASFILMVCSTEPHSYNMMDDVDYMLSSRTVQDVWGNWKAGLVRDTKGLKRGKFNGKEVVLAALGAGTSVRGLNIINSRPDVIIMDDIQTKECAQSEAENQALLEWLTGTLIKCRDMQRALLVYIGNMYNEDCILNHLRLHTQWQSFITGAVLSDWTTLWPALFSLEQLLDEYKHDSALGLGDIWFSEVMNIPVGGRLSLLPEGKIPQSIILDGEQAIGCFITIDPSGYRKNSDDTVIVVHKIYAPMHYRVEYLDARIMNPGVCINTALQLSYDWGATHIFCEDTAYQQSLQWHLQQAILEHPDLQGVEILPLKTGRRNKTSRIRAWIKTLLESSYGLAKLVRDAILFQALAFRIERTDNTDDILDACAYGLDVRNEWQDLVLDAYDRIIGDRSENKTRARVMANNSCLD